MNRYTTFALLTFALSFCFFAIQSVDVVMYLALARDFVFGSGKLNSPDPYLYSLSNAPLVWEHEYLSYIYFNTFYDMLGAPGLIFAKALLLLTIFSIPLFTREKSINSNPLWICMWVLAVIAGSFRFIERSSLFSDLFCVVLSAWLCRREHLRIKDLFFLAAIFLLWVQLHPGYPLGLCLFGLWLLHRQFILKTMTWKESILAMTPILALLINPLSAEGALYPFRFSLFEAQVLKRSNFEWFPSYHRSFRWTPEVIAFWILAGLSLLTGIKNRLFLELRFWMTGFALISSVQVVRFIPWACFATLFLLKPWLQFKSSQLTKPILSWVMTIFLLIVAFKNFSIGYQSSSGQRLAKLDFDPKFFPFKTLQVLRSNPIPGRLYNTHDFGSFLIWQKYTPVFHHGFVTDMNFYSKDVMGVFESQKRFLELAEKYGWTMLLVEKYGAYRYFHKILSPLSEWKIVAEDEASYLIYRLP